MSKEKPPELFRLLRSIKNIDRPIAFVLAGHNGSGKSTLWHDRLAPVVQMPLINADRLIMSRVAFRKSKGGHDVPHQKLLARFPLRKFSAWFDNRTRA